MNLREVILQPFGAAEEARFQAVMQAHHYLGALPKIGHTLWYLATWRVRWVALLSFSTAAWIGGRRQRFFLARGWAWS